MPNSKNRLSTLRNNTIKSDMKINKKKIVALVTALVFAVSVVPAFCANGGAPAGTTDAMQTADYWKSLHTDSDKIIIGGIRTAY